MNAPAFGIRARVIPAGTRFGRLTTTGEFERRFGMLFWSCVCDCGRRTIPQGTHLRAGRSLSCGCAPREKRAAALLKHGHARRRHAPSKILKVWRSMLNRCYYPKSASYQWYGQRGITVCEAWRRSFTQFVADMGPMPSPEHTIERNDRTGNYEPGNCRWATRKEQARNTSVNVRVQFNGREMALVEACELAGLSYSAVAQRIRKLRWTSERALSTPLRSAARA